jgi:ABC-type Zn uptake system ZnuABC Zn-binding protein ZnuA
MSEQKAVTGAMAVVVLLTVAVCGAMTALGAKNELVVVATFVVAGLGVDQVSKLILSYDSPDRR